MENIEPQVVEPWLNDALCKTVENKDIFHPDKGQQQLVRMAKTVCDQCTVRTDCLEYALEHREIGIWGGTTEKERRLIRRQRRGA